MKKIIACLMFIFLSGCVACIKKPDRYINKKTKTMNIPESCYQYEVCNYYRAAGKVQTDCKAEFLKCCKDTDYRYCMDPKHRPDGTTFSSCFDKLQ